MFASGGPGPSVPLDMGIVKDVKKSCDGHRAQHCDRGDFWQKVQEKRFERLALAPYQLIRGEINS